MNCIWSLISSCLLNGTYVSAGLESQFHASQFDRFYCNGRVCSGAKAVFRLGTAVELTPKLKLDVGVMHQSFANTRRDYGVESAYLNLRWRPFR